MFLFYHEREARRSIQLTFHIEPQKKYEKKDGKSYEKCLAQDERAAQMSRMSTVKVLTRMSPSRAAARV